MKNVFTQSECETIVTNIRYLMGLKGWGTGELAKQTNLAVSNLSLFLNNKKYVRLCTLKKIVDALDTTIPKLLKLKR